MVVAVTALSFENHQQEKKIMITEKENSKHFNSQELQNFWSQLLGFAVNDIEKTITKMTFDTLYDVERYFLHFSNLQTLFVEVFLSLPNL